MFLVSFRASPRISLVFSRHSFLYLIQISLLNITSIDFDASPACAIIILLTSSHSPVYDFQFPLLSFACFTISLSSSDVNLPFLKFIFHGLPLELRGLAGISMHFPVRLMVLQLFCFGI